MSQDQFTKLNFIIQTQNAPLCESGLRTESRKKMGWGRKKRSERKKRITINGKRSALPGVLYLRRLT
jgi:hypothetical protein